ncbi:Tf2-8, partial [Mucuna pruriens]
EATYIIQEVHEGVCGTHIGGSALASKIARAGYYWPTLRHDCMDYVKKCINDKDLLKATRHPQNACIRSHPRGLSTNGGGRHLGSFPNSSSLLTIDYFTKWVEAELVATISSERIKRFFWKKIICRFGIPAEIVSDNGTQFASLEHPQSNGQAEVENKVILKGLRKLLEEAKGRSVEELPQVLWSYHTTPHSTTNETPFRLTFGIEAMIPMEVGESSPRIALFEQSGNEEELRANLDILQDIREIAHVREYVVKARAARRYDKGIVPRHFKPQDLVLRRITQKVESNKLIPIWEGPFRILEEVGRGAYYLESLDGRRVPQTWNVATLRMYYS